MILKNYAYKKEKTSIKNIFIGNDLFGRIHELAGPELKTACENYVGTSVTSVRLTDSFEAKNFKSKFYVFNIYINIGSLLNLIITYDFKYIKRGNL